VLFLICSVCAADIDKAYSFGAPGWTPLVGDWNAGGYSSIGVTNGQIWYLDWNGNGTWDQGTDKAYNFGASGWTPKVGDWNGDRKTKIGVYRDSVWYLDWNGNGTWDQGTDKAYKFGAAGWTPVVGDWNPAVTGTKIGVYRDSVWYLDWNGNGTWDQGTDKAYKFGAAGWTPVIGDWNPAVTGTKIGVYRDSVWYLDWNGNGAWTPSSATTPTAAFTSNKQTGTAPLTVTFTDQSTGTAPLTYAWDFNYDGVDDSNLSNPTFTYETPGTYTVNLTVTNSVGSDSKIRYGYITVNEVPVAPVAVFFANKRSGTAPLTVRFTDSSTGTGPLQYAWDFTNDGEDDSDLSNPMFTYETPGTYSVKLTVTNAIGTDVQTKKGYITVTEGQPGGSHAGVAITFDDYTVDQWYAIRGILNKNNAHVTFFVSQFACLDQDEINKLKTLQADGNEIAFHGMYHEDAAAYLKTHSIQQYLDYEIIPGINLMKNEGFNPVDFSYPHGSDDPAATQALEGYFDHVRDTSYSWDDTIYYQYGSNKGFISGIGMDESYGHSITDIYNGISRAKTEDKILIFYGHEPVAANPQMYQTSHDRLEKILQYVSDNDLKTFTISELH
jgi:PKD repeat protein